MSILDSERRDSMPTQSTKHPAVSGVEAVLDAIIKDQDTGNSYVARVMEQAFGLSLTVCLMQAAHLRRVRLRHSDYMGSDQFTGVQG